MSNADAPGTADLSERLRERLAEEPDVTVVYLFGSHARGSAGPLSDVDVAVLLRDGHGPDRRLELADAVGTAAGGVRADVTVLNDAPPALAYRVLRDGELLLSRDDRARVRHWVRTVDRYLDMAPLRRELERGTSHRLEEGRFGRS